MSEPLWVPLSGVAGGVDYKGVWAAGTAYVSGDVVRYQGVDYLAVNPSTGQTPPSSLPTHIPLVTTLPASPVDGQEIALTDSLTAPSYLWRLRYNAGSAGANKWEFMGGSPFQSWVPSDESLTGLTLDNWYGFPTNVIFTVPRTGIYDVAAQARFFTGGTQTRRTIGLGIAGALPLAGPVWPSDFGVDSCIVHLREPMNLTAGQTIRLMYQMGSATPSAGFASLKLLELLPRVLS